ncbi:MAG: PTS sugar transporter subunit IIA [Phycisphaeraceae bacterium]|nr:PTS sugar transporter subunit IIA [Phycisphaeraceae bacterium]MCW5753100.1 PTS sugar transporter subunit IIA [Phycisphaeraceae bacterium]
MNLLDILSIDCIRAPLAAETKRAAIDELVDLLAVAGKVTNPGALKDAVWTREQTRTTGIGHGLAIPHGKCPGIVSLAMAIGKPSTPMDFEAIDSQPVRLIVLLASPPDRTSEHIQALARVSRLMTLEDFRRKIYEAETPEEIYELLRSADQR